MNSLLHQPFSGTEAEAAATIRNTSPTARFLFTPWPTQRIVEGVFFLGVGSWGSVEAGSRNVVSGLGCFVLVLALALFVAAPGIYTLRHADQAAHYYGATRTKGDAQARAHPTLVLAAFVAVGALAGAFAGHAPESWSTREVWAVIGAAFGLALGLARLRRGRLNIPGVSDRPDGEARG